MIKEFSVENFRSIKGLQAISFVPNKRMSKENDDIVCLNVNATTRLLKMGILYGYNASGKSNILLAFDFLRDLVTDGKVTKNEKTGFTPFLLDPATVNAPGTFSLSFYIEGILYEYTVTLDNDRIYSEVLQYRPEGRKAVLFSRSFDREKRISKISIGNKCGLSSADKVFLNKSTLENNTVLFSYQRSNINSEVIEKVVSYFRDGIMPLVTPDAVLKQWSFQRLCNDRTQKDFYVDLMKRADFQINDLEIKELDVPVEDADIKQFEAFGAPPAVIEKLKKDKVMKQRQLLFVHKNSIGEFEIDSEEESLGTKRFFGLGGVLKALILKSRFVAIDEIEASLHPSLVNQFLKMFLMNSSQSQLFCSTHNQGLMDLDYMRNDMIWFCEKKEDGSSEYYSAQDFQLHKNVSVSNFYRAGKLGAMPILGSPLLEGEHVETTEKKSN
jgi:AAA15 family ATPase/GTPase